ncbi:MAG: patatin-like phospholipase family protein [Kiloniellales bacterium]|nr:patatin-like phospholipase family protein [Kiloniellales bacterium]
MQFGEAVGGAPVQPVAKGKGRRVMPTVPPIVSAFAALLVAAGAIAGCARTVDHRPLSAAEYEQVDPSGPAMERWWGDAAPANLEQLIKKGAPVFRARFPEAVDATLETAPMLSTLVISGGGANGAFGAGLLAGWTESGERPQFESVTGVSTGAMIAPFAFLGPAYDPVLLETYASVTRDDVYRWDTVAGFLFGSALADTTPLKKQVETYITAELVEALAEQHRTGRSLFIITTHFDALRPMVWNIGTIANRGDDRAVALIRQIILASAAIPVLFPPVAIEWEAEGKRFTELHVDGALSSQVFAYPAQMDLGRLNEILGLTFRRQIFVILNGNAHSVYQPAPVTVKPIASRALKALLRNKANRDVERIYNLARRDNFGFNMISIPDSFRANRSTEFDPDYMRALIELGREIGREGDFWRDRPPNG